MSFHEGSKWQERLEREQADKKAQTVKSLPQLGNVAIVMPVYNAAKFLEKTVRCILDQSYSRWELFAVDDGSDDSSLEILRKFTDPRIRVLSSKDNVDIQVNDNGVITINKKSMGPAGARNKALQIIQASPQFKYVAYCDSDDRWKQDHLMIAMSNFSDCDMLYTDCDFVAENGTPVTTFGVPYYDKFELANLKSQNFIYISTVVHRVGCLGIGVFDEMCVPMEDYDMWLRIAQLHRVKHVQNITATYMFKDGGSYYSAEESRKSHAWVHVKNSIYHNNIDSLTAQLEAIKDMKTRIVRTQQYEEAARVRDMEKIVQAKIDMIAGPQSIEGWLSVEEGTSLARYGRDKDCLEIGSYKGKSANYIAAVANTLVCVDPFRADHTGQNQFVDYTTLQDFLKNTAKFKNITPVIGKSEDVHHQFKDDQFGMMFIDGMHDYDSVMSDIKNYYPKLKNGGAMCFHDYQKDWPGVIRAVDEFFGKPDFVHDTVAVCIKAKVDFVERFKDMKLTKEAPVVKKNRLNENFMLAKYLNMSMEDIGLLTEHERELFLSKLSQVENINKKKVLVSPWSHKLPNGKENPKNFPEWVELVKLLKENNCHVVQIGVTGEELIGADEVIFNASYEKLAILLNDCDTFISVDSFFPHFAHYHKKHGIVIFSQSDPNMFGYPENVNILKSRDYLRKEQFWLWTQAEYNKDAFVSPKDILPKVLEILHL
jgi:glycosyltransferase involved in cell wall biosynthesis